MVYILLADGFEEIEALAPTDMLRRSGVEVMTAAIDNIEVCGAHSISVRADIHIDDVDKSNISCIVLPGGIPGTLNLQKNEKVNELIDFCTERKIPIAAICAAPMILGELGLLKGRKAVCYPGYEKNLKGAEISDEAVAVSGEFITAKGAGAAFEFGAAIIDCLLKKDGAGAEIMAQMQCEI